MSTHATADSTLPLGVSAQSIKRRRSAIMPRFRQLQNPSFLALQPRLTSECFSALRWASRLLPTALDQPTSPSQPLLHSLPLSAVARDCLSADR